MDSDSAFSISSLLCRENEACFNEEVDEDSCLNSNNYLFSENYEEYIEMLVEREISFGCKTHGSSDDCSIALENWLKYARLDAVRWILNTRALFGFRFQTAYLSITYFDRFLSKRSIDSGKPWAIRLLSVACLTLASKMEECRVPALSEFRVEDYSFENNVIQRMELLVLNTLEWRMSSITPFTYLDYFITKFCDISRRKELESKAVELIVTVAKEMSLMDHRPSVIAAAAVLAAMDQRLTRKTVEFKMSVISSCGSLQNEHVFSCYNLMQELEMGKLKIPKFIISPDLSPIYSSSTKVTENSSFTSADGAKRRRLTFDDCSQNCGGSMSNEKHFC
ncbi:cyclin-D5-1-like isoform X2 [Telopea speciosissima]|uniref:cyclin-D5-1-like isoform X2 n=1 Tax=Telopea speciosissima TaxID=54955 RepID=UPI001CC36F88|nr:cyclin-D5-1-like isoform X2 [Telopea speciosissima]